jgi:signal transduction histidine kinase/DNA-binding response OmpR family regulator/HAMP domain-containing protein
MSEKKGSRRSLVRVLMAAFVMMAVVPLLLAAGTSGVTVVVSTVNRAYDGLESAADINEAQVLAWEESAAHSLTILLTTHITYNEALAVLTTPSPPDTTTYIDTSYEESVTRLQQHLGLFVGRGGVFDRLDLANMDGYVVAGTSPLSRGTSVSDEIWFQQGAGLEQGDQIIIGPMLDPATEEVGYFFVMPVSDYLGHRLGVMSGQVGLDDLVEMMRVPSGLGETGEQYLVTVDGDNVTPLRFEDEAAGDLVHGGITPGHFTMVDGHGQWTDYRGQPVFGTYRWIGSLNLLLVVKQDVNEVLGAYLGTFAISTIGILLSVVLAGILATFFSQRLTVPLQELTGVATRIASGDIGMRVPDFPQALEYQQLSRSFNAMASNLETLIGTLEDRVARRTRGLQVTADIGRTVAAEHNLEELLDRVTNMIRDRLGFYHVQVFLVDDVGESVVLRASTGEVGKQLLEMGHKLPIGSASVIGQVISQATFVVASDVETSAIHRRNELLPNTRAEAAVPLQMGSVVFGALDVQSTEPDVFDETALSVLSTIADELAVAIHNAQLFAEREKLLSASTQLTQLLTREGWGEFLSQAREQLVGYTYDQVDIRPVGAPLPGDGGAHYVSAPIQLRGEVIGELVAQPSEDREWTETDQALLEAVAERLALALENARLFEQTQKTLSDTMRLYDAGRLISEATTPEALLDALVGTVSADSFVDRAVVILLSDPDALPEQRRVRVSAIWKRDPSYRGELGEYYSAAAAPILAIEPMRPLIAVNDVATSEDLDPVTRQLFQRLSIQSVVVVPLLVAGRVLGWMMAQSLESSHEWTGETVRFYQTLTGQAGTALESLRLLEQTQQRALRLQATNEVSRAASSILDVTLLLPMIVDQIRDAFNYYHVQVFLLDETGENAALRASTGEVGRELMARQHSLPVGSLSVIGQVTVRGGPVIARDTDTDTIHRRNELLPDTRAEMAIPLKVGDRVIGALDVQSVLPDAFDQEAQIILQALADDLALALENAELFRQIQDRVAELTTINLVAQSVSQAHSLDKLYEIVAERLVDTFDVRHGFLGIYEAEARLIHFPIFVDGGKLLPPIEPMELGKGLASYVIETRQPLMINEDLERVASEKGARVVGDMTKSWLGVPLQIGDEVIGVLCIQDVARENAYNDGHVRMLSTLAAYIAVAIRNAKLLEETERRAAELGFLFDVTSAAVAVSELDDALARTAEILRDEIEGAEAVQVFLIDPESGVLASRAASGYGREVAARLGDIRIGEGLAGWAAQYAQSAVVGDIQSDERVMEGDDLTHSEVAVPLLLGSEVIGVLDVKSSHPDAFDAREVRLLQTLAGTLTAVIQSARLLDEIRRANEQLLELDALKSQFLANMSHELRTPLNSIIGFSRVILKGIDGPLTDLQSQDLEAIYAAGNHLLGLINDLLDLAKIEAGKMELRPEYVSLTDIIDGVVSTTRGLLKDKPIELVVDVEENLPPVWAEPGRLRQVLLNLVSNAAKFTYQGSITVRAQSHPANPETGDPECVQVDVVDTGIGISPEDMKKLFVAFSQVDGSTTRRTGGSGLGLAISRQFVEMHGGRIWVESEVGVGSTFSITVPLHPQPITSEPIPTLAPDETRPVILTIDDDPGVLDIYRRYLDKAGYAVIGVTNAQNIVDLVRQLQPVAVVLDVVMPGKDGWEAIAELKRGEDTRQVPVILCSIVEDRQRGIDLGAAEYLVKPILEDDLLAALKRTNGGRAAHRDVLVVDPDEDCRTRICEMLSRTGKYIPRAATSGEEGLAAALEQAPDVIILSLSLPDGDGLEWLTGLREHEAMREVPAILLTEAEISDEVRNAMDEHTTRLINRAAYTQEELLEGISQVLATIG